MIWEKLQNVILDFIEDFFFRIIFLKKYQVFRYVFWKRGYLGNFFISFFNFYNIFADFLEISTRKFKKLNQILLKIRFFDNFILQKANFPTKALKNSSLFHLSLHNPLKLNKALLLQIQILPKKPNKHFHIIYFSITLLLPFFKQMCQM